MPKDETTSVFLLVVAICLFGVGAMILLGGCFAVVVAMQQSGQYSHPEPGIFASVLGMFITGAAVGLVVLRHFLGRRKT